MIGRVRRMVRRRLIWCRVVGRCLTRCNRMLVLGVRMLRIGRVCLLIRCVRLVAILMSLDVSRNDGVRGLWRGVGVRFILRLHWARGLLIGGRVRYIIRQWLRVSRNVVRLMRLVLMIVLRYVV